MNDVKNINETLFNASTSDIIRGLEMELNHHVYEAEYPEEYQSEVIAEIACIRIFDVQRADNWVKEYVEQVAARPKED